MPVNKKVQLKSDSAGNLELKRNSSRKSDRKAPGTRWGTVTDWREGSNKTGEITGRYGRTLRDGQ
jgi:hypothetical protein